MGTTTTINYLYTANELKQLNKAVKMKGTHRNESKDYHNGHCACSHGTILVFSPCEKECVADIAEVPTCGGGADISIFWYGCIACDRLGDIS